MTSKRHTAPSPNRVEDDTLLDAARACVLADGVRRTTLSSVARAAGVSRMTLYRRFPDVRSLLAALMTREFGTLLTRAGAATSTSASARERLVAATVDGVCALVMEPLMRTLLDRDAELLLPYLVDRVGTVQRSAELFLREQLIAGHQDGSVRRADPTVQSRAIYLVAQSFVVSMRPATRDVDRVALVGELTQLLDAALRPKTGEDR
ncbi:MAG TPA: TetR/AcrR family transcriptional regulator [Actinophytocola sp.]|uniref:TetR/AcrR family transcriptional regulator n=1 Tax=Actinophytocola sp. TaxID=1872138 RepID=UPI002DBA12E8|nr:TetR/AcrR family transcriptional regulator [Actinophytocola sp.]HEU5475419.1 TetR/AcrR family transcriptional regulator [Actinophytocola sp.]